MKQYFYIDRSGGQHGPVDINELRLHIDESTPVWTESMSDWTEAGKVDELSRLFGNSQPAPTEMTFEYAKADSPKPDSWLVWSILATILCCPSVLGIPAIVFATSVDKLWYQGRHEDARMAARNARIWTIIAASVGLCFYIMYIFLFFIGMAGAIANFR